MCVCACKCVGVCVCARACECVGVCPLGESGIFIARNQCFVRIVNKTCVFFLRMFEVSFIDSV